MEIDIEEIQQYINKRRQEIKEFGDWEGEMDMLQTWLDEKIKEFK